MNHQKKNDNVNEVKRILNAKYEKLIPMSTYFWIVAEAI